MPDDDTTTATDDLDTTVDDTTATDDDAGTSTAADDAGKAAPKPTAPKDKAPVIDGDFDADRAKRLIARVRAEAEQEKAARRVEQEKSQALLKTVAKALGFAEEDKPDPEKLTAQLEEARAAERQRRTELQVLRLAPGIGADADALLDSQAFSRAIKDLDPAAGSFREDVEDAIRDHLTKYPRHKAVAPAAKADDDSGSEKKTASKKDAGRSGADMNGAGSKPHQVTAAELAKMTPQQIVEAQEKGLLAELLGS